MVTARSAVVLLSTILLAGCTSDEGGAGPDAAASPSTPTSSAQETQESEEAEEPGTASPTTTDSSSPPADVPFPDVEPAAGLVIKEASITLRAPAGWQEGPRAATNQSSAAGPGDELLSLVEQHAMGRDVSLDEAADIALQGRTGQGDLQRLPDVETDGQVWYRIAGPATDDPFVTWLEDVGTVRDGKLVTISFGLDEKEGSYRDDPQLVESVLNTVEWK